MFFQEQDLPEHNKYDSSCASDEMLGWTVWCGIQLMNTGTYIWLSNMSMVLSYICVQSL